MSAATVQPRADGPIEHGLLVGTVAALCEVERWTEVDHFARFTRVVVQQ